MVELTRTQQTIARRMAESKATIPHFALQADVDMEACVALRSELKERSPAERVRPYVQRHGREGQRARAAREPARELKLPRRQTAAARARQRRRRGRRRIGRTDRRRADRTDGVRRRHEVPRRDRTGDTRAGRRRVRDGTITPPELGGGTFTVSNLGMFGVSELHRDRQPARRRRSSRSARWRHGPWSATARSSPATR